MDKAKNKKEKIIQITSNNDNLYILTNKGRVFEYFESTGQIIELSELKDLLKNEKNRT